MRTSTPWVGDKQGERFTLEMFIFTQNQTFRVGKRGGILDSNPS
ncbi:hypothetical protein CRD_01751 [Raphidiopsis brookii D9]|nr:hypothetical protein CRD_01751 [Raphidiopsis brookii D9]